MFVNSFCLPNNCSIRGKIIIGVVADNATQLISIEKCYAIFYSKITFNYLDGCVVQSAIYQQNFGYVTGKVSVLVITVEMFAQPIIKKQLVGCKGYIPGNVDILCTIHKSGHELINSRGATGQNTYCGQPQ